MRHADNENEELSFIMLAASTANVTRYLQPNKKQQEQRERQTERDRTDEQRDKDHREYVEQRLKETAAFERRVSGNKN